MQCRPEDARLKGRWPEKRTQRRNVVALNLVREFQPSLPGRAREIKLKASNADKPNRLRMVVLKKDAVSNSNIRVRRSCPESSIQRMLVPAIVGLAPPVFLLSERSTLEELPIRQGRIFPRSHDVHAHAKSLFNLL